MVSRGSIERALWNELTEDMYTTLQGSFKETSIDAVARKIKRALDSSPEVEVSLPLDRNTLFALLFLALSKNTQGKTRYVHVASFLKQKRKKTDYTSQQIAEMIGVSQSTYACWESWARGFFVSHQNKGKWKDYDQDTVIKDLAEVFHVNHEDFRKDILDCIDRDKELS